MAYWTRKRVFIFVIIFAVLYSMGFRDLSQHYLVRETRGVHYDSHHYSTIPPYNDQTYLKNVTGANSRNNHSLAAPIRNLEVSEPRTTTSINQKNSETKIADNYFVPKNKSFQFGPLPYCSNIFNSTLFDIIPAECRDNIGLAPFCVYKHPCTTNASSKIHKNISIVTMLSLDRMDSIYKLLESDWPGPIFISMYVKVRLNGSKIPPIVESICSINSPAQVTLLIAVSMHERYFSRDGLLPINAMRAIAALEAQKSTEYIFHLDIDFKIPMNIYNNLTVTISQIEANVDGGMKKTALVVPSFECYDAHLRVPKTKAELLKLLGKREITIFHYEFPPAQWNTDYKLWKRKQEPYEIYWDIGYEPWHIVHRTAPVPDVRFVGRGMNKKAFTFQLYKLGYKFYVAPNAFILHYPHEKSSDYWRSGDHGPCIKLLYHIFHDQSNRSKPYMGM